MESLGLASAAAMAARRPAAPPPMIRMSCWWTSTGPRLRFDWKDGDRHAAARLAELHVPVDQGKDGVILGHADVQPRVPLGAALPGDDRAGRDQLTAEPLDAERLARTVASVFGTALTFLA